MKRRFTIQELVQLAEQEHASRTVVDSYLDKIRVAVEDLARLAVGEGDVLIGASSFDEIEGVLVELADKGASGPVSDFAENRPNADKGKKIFVGVVNHRHGANYYAGWTLDEVKDQIADYAREWWVEERRGAHLRKGPPPSDRDGLISDYFESVDGDEDWSIDETIIYGGQSTLGVDLVRDGVVCDKVIRVSIEETTTPNGALKHRELRIKVESGGDPSADLFITVDESRRDLKVLTSTGGDANDHTIAIFPERQIEQVVERE